MTIRDCNADILNYSQEFDELVFMGDSYCGMHVMMTDNDYLAVYCKKLADIKHLRTKLRQKKDKR